MISVAPAPVPDATPTTPAASHSPHSEDQQHWRNRYPVHPCANVYPLMSDGEIDALAADIKANGLRQPVVLWTSSRDKRTYVLDGRNRLEALARLGPQTLATPNEPNTSGLPNTPYVFEQVETVDPAVYVIGANIRRRHLTKEQQAELIVRTIEAAKPNDSAKAARSFSPKPGKRGGSTKDPLRQKAVDEGRKMGISSRTMQNARAKVQGKAATQPAKTKATTPPATKTKNTMPIAEPITAPAPRTDAAPPKVTPQAPLPAPALEEAAEKVAASLVRLERRDWNDVLDRAQAIAKARLKAA